MHRWDIRINIGPNLIKIAGAVDQILRPMRGANVKRDLKASDCDLKYRPLVSFI